jgi:hypothetical protein
VLAAIATLASCATPATTTRAALPRVAAPTARARGWQLWQELTASPTPAWESWLPSERVFAADAPAGPIDTLTFRSPHDIRMDGRIVVPASQPLLYSVLLDEAAVDHVRAHRLASRAELRGYGAAIPAFPPAARAVKLVWYPIKAVGTTDVPVWDGRPSRADADGNPPTAWRRRVTVSVDGAPGTVPVDRFYHRTLATATERDAARLAWHDDDLAIGDVVVLVAVHLTTKDVPDWTWTTLWWHDAPDRGPFAADRPPSITGWAASYVMDATLDAAMPCMNPWLEARFPDGLASNCVSCHERAAAGAREFLPVTTGRTPATDAYFAGKTSTDFMWSVALESR